MAGIKGGDRLEARLAGAQRVVKNEQVEVGFLSGATNSEGVSIPMYAAINEFGAPSRGQPPRPFFRRMIAEHSKDWPGQIAKVLKANSLDTHKTLATMGAVIAGELQQSIRDLVDPPLAPSTVKRKGFDKPLIDTSDMLKSVDWVVVAPTP